MEAILNKLVESLNGGNFLLASVVVCLGVLFNCKKIYEHLEERKKSRILKIKEALESPHIQGPTKNYLEELLATEYFKISTGIGLEKEFREALIQAHKNAKGNLSFTQFKRALPHLYYENNSLAVKIFKFEKAVFIFNAVAGPSLVLFGYIFAAWLPILSESDSLSHLAFRVGSGLVFMCFGFYMLWELAPVISAKRVKSALEKAPTEGRLNFSND